MDRGDASNNDKMISPIIPQYVLATPDTFDPPVHIYNYLGGLPAAPAYQVSQLRQPDDTVFLSAV